MFLYLLADAETVSDGIFKYVAGGMALGIVGLCVFIKSLYADVKEIPEKIKTAEGTIRDKYAKVFEDLEKKHKTELDDEKKHTKELRDEKDRLYKDQISDLKDEVKSFSEMSRDTNTLLEDTVAPLLVRNSELLDYYKQKREKEGKGGK